MGFTKKVPVTEVEGDSVEDVVLRTLREDPTNAYTIMGIMVEKFGVKESEVNGKPFSQWKKGYPSLYTKIRIALQRAAREGKVQSKKHGKAVVYWSSGRGPDAIDRVAEFSKAL